MNRVAASLAVGAVIAASSAFSARADDVARGRRLFEECRSCHAREAGKDGMAGPNLVGLNGRRFAGDADFDYSPALRDAAAKGGAWDAERLMAFLADPQGMFPGLWMGGRGVRDETDRRALAAYLLQDAP